MQKRGHKYHTEKLTGALGTREFVFDLTPEKLSWKEKGKSEETRVTRSWEDVIGYALVFAPDPGERPLDARRVGGTLSTPDRAFSDVSFEAYFCDAGLYIVICHSAEMRRLTWRNLLNLGLRGH